MLSYVKIYKMKKKYSKLTDLSKKITLDQRSKYLRKLVMRGFKNSQKGHVGSALSMIEILRVLYDHILKYDIKKLNWEQRDRLIVSQGWASMGLYAILADKGFFKLEELDNFMNTDSILGVGGSQIISQPFENFVYSDPEFSWYDTGNIESLTATRDYFERDIEVNILDKEEEAIWFANSSVIKFSTDKNFIANRLQRTKQLGDFIPRITDSSENMYKYNWIEGEVLSINPTLNKFKQFLEWILQAVIPLLLMWKKNQEKMTIACKQQKLF